jgi:hypothetical protein
MSELIIQDFGGRLNGDMSGTRARLIKGGSWKKQRIVCIIPSDSKIPAKCALAIWNLVFPPNQGVARILAVGCEVGDAYSQSIEGCLAHPELSQFEFVLTIEMDNAPPNDGVIQLVEILENRPELSAISGSYFTKGIGGCWQGWGDVSDPLLNFRPQIPEPGKVKEVYGLGMGFCLYRLSMFKDKRLSRPLFKTKADRNGAGTQDLMFWAEARKYGYRAAVACDVHVGHYDLDGKFGPPDTMW